MTEIIYRPIKEGEVSYAAQIEKDCLSTPWSESQISSIPSYACYLGAFCGDSLCGIGSAYFIADECQIMNIAVSPQYRKKGIGKGIMDNIVNLATEKNCVVISLEVAENNLDAISLYQKCGFASVGKRKNFYGSISALIMEKNL